MTYRDFYRVCYRQRSTLVPSGNPDTAAVSQYRAALEALFVRSPGRLTGTADGMFPGLGRRAPGRRGIRHAVEAVLRSGSMVTGSYSGQRGRFYLSFGGNRPGSLVQLRYRIALYKHDRIPYGEPGIRCGHERCVFLARMSVLARNHIRAGDTSLLGREGYRTALERSTPVPHFTCNESRGFVMPTIIMFLSVGF